MNPVIAQSDLVTGYGWGLDTLWNGLMSGRTSIQPSARFAEREFAPRQVALAPDLDVKPGESRSMAMLSRLLAPLAGKLDRKTPLILATTVGEIEYVEQAVFGENSGIIDQARPDMLLGRIKQLLGLTGPAMVLSSACASSTAAVARAAAMVRGGLAQAVLVVTFDVVSEFVYSGFSTLLSLCETPARPFDAERSGLSLGEAAAWALITSDESITPAESTAILGWGSASDAVHMTAPDRNACGLSRAIAKACRKAGREAADISFIAAHGTATIYNDAMELRAFQGTIGNPIPLFSIKGGIGHTLATAGLIQILVASRALSLGVVPPTVGMLVPDPNAEGWVHDSPIALTRPTLALSTNSGFGGVNSAILLGVAEKEGRIALPPSRSAAFSAAAWFCKEYCGTHIAGGPSTKRPAPVIHDSKEMLALIGRPVKYLARMTPQAQTSLTAASMAVKAAGWSENAHREIGILSGGYDAWLEADVAYFRDYVAGGLSLGRANLFIYTLPTSIMGEVSIALGLTGPTLHMQDDTHPLNALIREAKELIKTDEADAILVLWSDAEASICIAIDKAAAEREPCDVPWEGRPLEIARNLASRA